MINVAIFLKSQMKCFDKFKNIICKVGNGKKLKYKSKYNLNKKYGKLKIMNG